MTIYLDFETYSELNIREVGAVRYITHPSTQIICLGYALNDDEPSVWSVGQDLSPLLDAIHTSDKVYAYNAMFDWRVWNYIGCRDFNWPKLPLGTRIIDVQALCACYQIPQNLDDAGTALGITHRKDKAGSTFIKLCCQPDRTGLQPFPHDHASRQAFDGLFKYCARDVVAMREVVKKLPRPELIPQEQDIWLLTQAMNNTGLPIDYKAVRAINNYLQKYVEEATTQLPTITGGKVTTPGQIKRIVDWCAGQEVFLPNLTAETVESTLLDEGLPFQVRRVLELRQELGRSSTAKYKKILAQAHGDNGEWRVYDNLRYHGAGTGRWTGQGFQMHNLPRATVENPEEMIEAFINNQTIENPVYVAKALIRSMIQAPNGYTLAVADYTAIENWLLAWAAKDEVTLQNLIDGKDQYKDMASARFHVDYDNVTPEQRRIGKVIILGCGYGMGKKRFREVAAANGIIITEDEAQESVDAYRFKYHLVKELWAGCRNAATQAVITGKSYSYNDILFGTFARNGIRWLAMKLPTGKCLYYANPSIKEELIKDYEYMGPVPCVTHYGTDPYTKKWTRLKLIPGRIVENYVQATAREVMAYGMLNVVEKMPFIQMLGSVHDEAIAILPKTYATDGVLEEFNREICNVNFIPGCPLRAKGFFSKRYKKD